MASSSEDPATCSEPVGQDHVESLKGERLRRYSYVVTAAMIVLCNGVLLLGLWGSGVKLDSLIRIPDPFNPMKDVCLRLSWHRVIGLEEPIRLCSEWINLSDPSGETHKFQKETQVVQGGDGKLYFDHRARGLPVLPVWVICGGGDRAGNLPETVFDRALPGTTRHPEWQHVIRHVEFSSLIIQS